MSARIAACLLNISEARNYKVVRDVAEAALKGQKQWVPCCLDSYHKHEEAATVGLEGSSQANAHCFKSRAAVLNIFADVEYNRSVITIVAPVEYLEQSLFQACIEAFDKIDLSQQQGGHPRLGVVDLIPIHPLNNALSVKECGIVARKLANRIVKCIPGTSVFLFGAADLPLQRSIVQRRKEINWYAGAHGENLDTNTCDIGGNPSNRHGITGIGAMPYMTNFNVTIGTNDLIIGNAIAKHIRASSSTGLKGVQSMAFSHDGKIEIACNVETLDLQLKHKYTGPSFATFDEIQQEIEKLCDHHGISIFGSAIIGFRPEEAYERAIDALKKDEDLSNTKFDNKRM